MRLADTYLGRCLLFNRPTSHDQARMPQRRLSPSPQPLSLPRRAAPALDDIAVGVRRDEPPTSLRRLLQSTGTTALLALHDGAVVVEWYFAGAMAHQPQRCFSVTKSVASALIGLAIAAGRIESPDQEIGVWLPELRDRRIAALPLSHLLRMHSGIGFSEGPLPWRDEPRTYYATDLRQRLAGLTLSDPVGAFFHYNDWHPLLLALILERATGQQATRWLQQRLWDPLGAEHAASMMVDRDDDRGLEHLESGLTATATDLAKFGQLYLQDGLWRGERLLPEGWVARTTAPAGARTDADWFRHYRSRPWGRFLATGKVYYQGLWWGQRLDDGGHDFFAMGVLGQHVYVSPDTATVIVRLSDRFPPGVWWAPVWRQVALALAGR